MSDPTVINVGAIAAASGISAAIGLMAASLWGILRKKAVAHVKVSSPESRDIKRLQRTARRHAFLIQIGAERQALHARGSILLANAVRSGNQAQVDKALDFITASENQYLAAVQTKILREDQRDDDVEEAEQAEEPR